MQNLLNFYIGGNWTSPKSSLTMPVLNPATETQVASVAMGNKDDVNDAVAAATTAWETFSKTSKSERLELLRRLKNETEKRLEDLAQAMRIEMGAPISMSREAQADAAVGHLGGFIDALKQLQSKKNTCKWRYCFKRTNWGVRTHHAMELAYKPNCTQSYSCPCHWMYMRAQAFRTYSNLGDDLC